MRSYDIFCKSCVKIYQIDSNKKRVPRVNLCPRCSAVAISIITESEATHSYTDNSRFGLTREPRRSLLTMIIGKLGV